MKIYTRTGDEGTTALYGGDRVPKHDLRVRAYGSVDELNAQLGMARAFLDDPALDRELHRIQNTLFDVGADLATPADAAPRASITPIDGDDVGTLEGAIDRHEADLEPLRNFILPGGHQASACLQVARAVARRAEREVVALAERTEVNPQVTIWLNRLSDLLFVLSRTVNARHGVSEARWHVRDRRAVAGRRRG